MSTRTRIELGRRADLGADCANCFGLCCVALAFTKSADFPFDKPAGDPCTNLDEHDGCRIHSQLRERGFKGCTVFDCFGAGQKVSRQTFAGRSWRDDTATREAMFSTFPLVRRLHELLWYLDEAITLVERERAHAAAAEHVRARAATPDPAPWLAAFEHVRSLTDGTPDELAALDVDAEYDAARPLLVQASEVARAAEPAPPRRSRGKGPTLEPGSDLMCAPLVGADLSGRTLRGSIAIAADLRGADLDRCDLLGVDLRDAELGGADLSGAIYLTQMQVNSARGDGATRLPEGFARPTHWADGR
ncbi:pentapeptide repeat-containing protein [Frigoribacterium faeni]|uniref:pentapeptide repeat-containing protein n=1 Tax=Frigoribacterium faeni TaxID=145483 RepID=UPI0024133F16|nr:pentapeptide repeat-containing protein [Frigoribacterium faeni]